MNLPTTLNAEPIPGYRLIERLGRGGYGEVWKVEAPGGMHKAIKFVYGDMEGAGDDGKAAEQEFKSLKRVKSIRHPFILSLERIEIIDGQLVIVMELADRNLFDRYAECVASGLSGIPRAELISYMEEAAEALDLMNLHYQIQHLDIKPHNIFLIHRHVKVADFGLAKDLEGTRGELTGGITPMYAPPETFEQWVSRQSDQYSLAIVYMEMLIGRRPFNGTNTRQLILQHLTAIPDLTGLQSPDREAVARALAKKPDDRFRTCMDFVKALKGELPTGMVTESDPVTPGVAAPVDTPLLGNCSTQPLASFRPRTLPALITPRSKTSYSGAKSPSRLQSHQSSPSIEVRTDPVEQNGTGVLFPALVVGIGGTGLAVLRSLRQIISDRFNRPTLPHLRWLFIDTDPEAVRIAQAGSPDSALAADEVLHMRLHRPTHYLSRDGMPPIESWLSSEELFQMPRTPATDHVRTIGRLALVDHYHVLCHRIRTALEPFLTPSRIEEADNITGLGIRSSFPRVYVATSLGGGTGSGMFIDLTYLIRRELRRLGFGTAQTLGLFALPGASIEPANRRALANARAALTELQHFGPDAPYWGNFDTREKAIEDSDRPFHRCTLFTLPDGRENGAAECLATTIAHIAFAETLSPIGKIAHPDSVGTGNNALTAVGIRRVVWPRAQVLRAGAWQYCRQTIANWLGKGNEPAISVPSEFIDNQWKERKLDRTTLRSSLVTHLTTTLGSPPDELIASFLAGVRDDANPQTSMLARTLLAFRQLVELLGKHGPDERESPYAVGNALTKRVQKLAIDGDAKLSTLILSLVEQPTLRMPGAEEAIRVLRLRISDELTSADAEATAIEDGAVALFQPIYYQLVAPEAEASRSSFRSIPELLAALRQWATTRLEGLIARAVANVYRVLLGNVPEHVRELNFIRGQMSRFLRELDTNLPSIAIDENICVPVFPGSATNVPDAAKRLLGSLKSGDSKEFENALQARICRHYRGLVELCLRPKDSGPGLLSLMGDEAFRFLDARLPKESVPKVLLQKSSSREAMQEWMAKLVNAAVPEGLGDFPTTVTVAGLPEGDKETADLIRRICPKDTVRIASSPDDVVIWREFEGLKAESFVHLSLEQSSLPAVDGKRPRTAHSRTDIDW